MTVHHLLIGFTILALWFGLSVLVALAHHTAKVVSGRHQDGEE